MAAGIGFKLNIAPTFLTFNKIVSEIKFPVMVIKLGYSSFLSPVVDATVC